MSKPRACRIVLNKNKSHRSHHANVVVSRLTWEDVDAGREGVDKDVVVVSVFSGGRDVYLKVLLITNALIY